MTGPEHFRSAERRAAAAETFMDADTGWKGTLTTAERLAFRTADLLAAQYHATMALAAATALPSQNELSAGARAWQDVTR